MLVYIHSNYSYPDLLRQTPDSNGVWEGIQFTFNEVDECDYIVVINHPTKDIKVKCRKGGRILLIQEPPYERNNYLTPYFRYFDKIICAFDQNTGNILNNQAALPWHINKTFDELSELTFNKQKKNDRVSFITSNKNFYPEHTIRLNFIKFMNDQSFDFDLFGSGFKPLKDKFDGIFDYKYTLAAENYIAKDYFTEKIIDAFLSWTMPIYYGCTNITNYFPPESMIQVDLKNPQVALAKIKYAITNKLWDKNIEAIKEARDLVLNKYQFFPMFHNLLKNNAEITDSSKYVKVFIPISGLSKMEQLKKTIRDTFSILNRTLK